MSLRIPVDRVRALVRLLGEVRERVCAGENGFSALGRSVCRVLGADVVVVAIGSQVASVGTRLLDLKSFGLSEGDAAQARRVYLVGRDQVVNLAAAKVLALSNERGDFAVKRRRDVVCDDAWYRSDFVNVQRRAWGLDDTIYGSHVTAEGRLLGFGSARAWGARPFTEEDCALAGLFWESCAAELAPPESPLSRRQSETLRLLLEGHSAKVIAAKLHLSVNTVNEYIHAIYQAKNVRSRGELMAQELRRPRKTGA